ncbi:long-chain specific acyl-CoA dehydrogenase, mitochondrial isoform X2 [Equus przewalskii]|uniref:Long-chain specific acyl-CoA dehydrogenase, mitochondrial isoform X2 n=1 Tax=Equus przewalskii TaxID=9798 RepID=A0ABM4PAP2_EQUPR
MAHSRFSPRLRKELLRQGRRCGSHRSAGRVSRAIGRPRAVSPPTVRLGSRRCRRPDGRQADSSAARRVTEESRPSRPRQGRAPPPRLPAPAGRRPPPSPRPPGGAARGGPPPSPRPPGGAARGGPPPSPRPPGGAARGGPPPSPRPPGTRRAAGPLPPHGLPGARRAAGPLPPHGLPGARRAAGPLPPHGLPGRGARRVPSLPTASRGRGARWAPSLPRPPWGAARGGPPSSPRPPRGAARGGPPSLPRPPGGAARGGPPPSPRPPGARRLPPSPRPPGGAARGGPPPSHGLPGARRAVGPLPPHGLPGRGARRAPSLPTASRGARRLPPSPRPPGTRRAAGSLPPHGLPGRGALRACGLGLDVGAGTAWQGSRSVAARSPRAGPSVQSRAAAGAAWGAWHRSAGGGEPGGATAARWTGGSPGSAQRGRKEEHQIVGCPAWLYTVLEQRAFISRDKNISFTTVRRGLAATASRWSAGQWSQGEHSRGKERPETPSAKKLTDIGIRRIFSSEHDIFWESVRKFFQEELIPRHADWAGPGFSLHSDIVMPCIANHVSEEQMKHVPLVMAGRCTGAVAVREPRLEGNSTFNWF